MEHDLTRGNVLKTIAVFALPYMLSYFLQMLYGMADLYMMGQFSGAAGITAVGNGAQTLYIITVTLVGLAMGRRSSSATPWVRAGLTAPRPPSATPSRSLWVSRWCWPSSYLHYARRL